MFRPPPPYPLYHHPHPHPHPTFHALPKKLALVNICMRRTRPCDTRENHFQEWQCRLIHETLLSKTLNQATGFLSHRRCHVHHILFTRGKYDVPMFHEKRQRQERHKLCCNVKETLSVGCGQNVFWHIQMELAQDFLKRGNLRVVCAIDT
jgi:hypothetical protein